jgi:hypothetical protein
MPCEVLGVKSIGFSGNEPDTGPLPLRKAFPALDRGEYPKMMADTIAIVLEISDATARTHLQRGR